MKRFDITTMGGSRNRFQSTDWSEIQKAKTSDESRRRDVVGNLIRMYWKPVYCYLIRRGYDNELAKDLTQDFFYEVILGKHLIQKADKSKGRFRKFLLKALRNFVIDRSRIKHRLRLVSLKDFGDALPSEGMKPDDVFNYAWVSLLLDNVINEVERGCSRDGLEIHWKLFYERILKPIIDDTKPPSLTKLCKQLNIMNQNNTASNMIVTVKRRFRRVLEDYVRQHVESDIDVDDELNGLLRTLTKSCAR